MKRILSFILFLSCLLNVATASQETNNNVVSNCSDSVVKQAPQNVNLNASNQSNCSDSVEQASQNVNLDASNNYNYSDALVEQAPQNVNLNASNQLSVPSNQHYLSLWRTIGRSIYSKRGYTSIEAFSFPLTIKNTHPFIDFRYHHFDNGSNAFSLGGGVRFCCLGNICGVNAFYDYRTGCHSGFNQLGIGLESLGECWNFRLNGYIPVGESSRRCSFCFFNGYSNPDFFFQEERFLDSFGGFNFEIEHWTSGCCGDLGIAVSPYYYNRKKGCKRNVYGSQLRLTAELCNLSLSLIGSYDNVFHGRLQAQVGFIFPFYFQKSDCKCFHVGCQCSRLYQRVERNDAIILKRHNKWTWNF